MLDYRHGVWGVAGVSGGNNLDYFFVHPVPATILLLVPISVLVAFILL